MGLCCRCNAFFCWTPEDLKDRSPMNSISLTCDISAITAIWNDYGYENIFSRQLEGVWKFDVLIAMSTVGFLKIL